jgi:hypothetical protein
MKLDKVCAFAVTFDSLMWLSLQFIVLHCFQVDSRQRRMHLPISMWCLACTGLSGGVGYADHVWTFQGGKAWQSVNLPPKFAFVLISFVRFHNLLGAEEGGGLVKLVNDPMSSL